MSKGIETYSKISHIRDLLKSVQQLSWNITKFDKKFPLEDSENEDYPALLDAYLRFNDELQGLADLFRKEIVDDKTINEIKMKPNKNANESDPH